MVAARGAENRLHVDGRAVEAGMLRQQVARAALVALFPVFAPTAPAQRTSAVDELLHGAGWEESVVETDHYELRLAGPATDGAELGLVLEAAYLQFEALFRAAPRARRGERVVVHLVPDRETWLARMRDAGIEPPAGADFAHYSPADDRVFVYRQRTDWLTRSVLIHAACQQFHCKCKPKNRDLARTWIAMALGDHLATHTWDGKTLVLGAATTIDPADMMGRALQRIDPGSFDPTKLYVEGLAHAEVGFAIVRFALDGEDRARRKGFEKLALGYSGSKLDQETYTTRLGEPVELVQALLPWLAQHQSPLRTLAGDWEDLGQRRLVGSAPGRGAEAVAAFKRPFERLRVRVPRGDLQGRIGGVILHHQDDDHWLRAFVTADGVLVRETRRGELAREYELVLAGTEPVELELERVDDGFLVRAGAEERHLREVAGERPGLFVREGPLELTLLDRR